MPPPSFFAGCLARSGASAGKPAAGIAAALAIVATVSMAPTAASSRSAAGFRPSCKAVTEPASKQFRSPPSRAYNVAFRVRCNFRVTELKLRSSKSLVGVLKRAALERPDPEDALDCARRSRIFGRCTGEVGQQVLIRGAIKVKGDPCCSEKLRVGFRAFGGQDCDPPSAVCRAIRYHARVLVKRPRGCPRRACARTAPLTGL